MSEIETGEIPNALAPAPISGYDCELIHWSELYKAGKVNGSPIAAMLRGDYVQRKDCKLDGDLNDAPNVTRAVIYDRAFVLNQMRKHYRLLLSDCTELEWLTLCADLYGQVYDKKPTRFDMYANGKLKIAIGSGK
jgi:hypothetical protein